MACEQLHIAVQTCNHHICRKLILQGVDPLCLDQVGNTALHLACNKGCIWYVIELTKPVCSLEVPNFELLAQFSIPQKSDHLNRRGERCLHVAVKRGYLELVEYLVETKYKADINQPTEAERYTPLHLAVINKDPFITAYLLC